MDDAPKAGQIMTPQVLGIDGDGLRTRYRPGSLLTSFPMYFSTFIGPRQQFLYAGVAFKLPLDAVGFLGSRARFGGAPA
ncbi:hypothetical protein [Mesorhizobium sp. M0843]|uniref:hypothetical protein n=1 Tax=Mesorhizobium sp. M0843 TaxID=2957010 RepID=UPI00333DDC6D